MGEIRPIIYKSFYLYAEEELTHLGRAEMRMLSEVRFCDGFLEDFYSSSNTGVANDNRAPTEQIEWVSAHENLIDSMNQKLLNLSYLMKIANHIPDLIKEFGPVYPYMISNGEGVVRSFNIDLVYFSDPENITQEMHDTIQHCFDYVHEFRKNFTPKTWQELEKDTKQDSFSNMFLQNKLVEPCDMHSRIEVAFFVKFGIPLGVFETHQDVGKWMKRCLLNEGVAKNVFNKMTSFELQTKFPGILCPHLHELKGITTKMRHDFSTAFSGVIPRSGIVVGEVSAEPPRTKPLLLKV